MSSFEAATGQCQVSNLPRWVHVDFKGAPPLPPGESDFWERWCSYIVTKGRVAGLIMEFEDVLPIPLLSVADETGKQEGSGRIVYTKDQLRSLLHVAAAQNGLQIIPLIQTFGHLEYLLKYRKYKEFREVSDYPDSLRPAENSSSQSLHLACRLLDEVVLLLKELKLDFPAIHLGGDEVWHMGQGERSKERLLNHSETRLDIYLKHMSLVSTHVLKTYPTKRILMWDDMLRGEKITTDDDSYRVLRENAELVVWQYAVEPAKFLPVDLFRNYSSIHSKPPWIAAAFRGASSSCAQVPDLGLHVGNHLAWRQCVESGQPFGRVEVAGIVMTGWQRFDHYASLCELLPVSVPSLRCCFEALDRGKFTDAELQLCFDDLGLQNPQIHGNAPKFPGAELYVFMTKFVGLRNAYLNFTRHDTLTTWVNEWQIKNKRVSRLQSDAILGSLRKLLQDIEELSSDFDKVFELYFFPSTIEEWFGTYIAPMKDTLSHMINSITAGVSDQ